MVLVVVAVVVGFGNGTGARLQFDLDLIEMLSYSEYAFRHTKFLSGTARYTERETGWKGDWKERRKENVVIMVVSNI